MWACCASFDQSERQGLSLVSQRLMAKAALAGRFLLDGEYGSRPPVDQRTRLATRLELANAFAVDAGLMKQLPPMPDAVALHCSRLV